ncbi:virion glycoprotein I [Leporid alphaherpesvirus 4]|uniref:Envelope glycoprotein I n=1 Tax=Leporid alphaherpesvirus 4 TaxID=481315 RepID=J9QYR2_9ALPH|nr:virion glycoprotein I [Leporid alphaherpesvirus 4]AFR32508.1 virion glycoprotein I [Leporid alphaherpesvirus 4]
MLTLVSPPTRRMPPAMGRARVLIVAAGVMMMCRVYGIVLRGHSVSLASDRLFDVWPESAGRDAPERDLTIPGELFFVGGQVPSQKYYDGVVELFHEPSDGSCDRLVYVGKFAACPRRPYEAFVLCRDLREDRSPAYPGLSLELAGGTLLRVRHASPWYAGTYRLRAWVAGAKNASVFPMTLGVGAARPRDSVRKNCVGRGAPQRDTAPLTSPKVYRAARRQNTSVPAVPTRPARVRLSATLATTASPPHNAGARTIVVIAASLGVVVVVSVLGACVALRVCARPKKRHSPAYRRAAGPIFIATNEPALERLQEEMRAGAGRRVSRPMVPALHSIEEEPAEHRPEERTYEDLAPEEPEA